MIVAPVSKECNLCGGVAELMWTHINIDDWHFLSEMAPRSDNVELKMKCRVCGNYSDVFDSPEEEVAFGYLKFKLVSSLISSGGYSYFK